MKRKTEQMMKKLRAEKINTWFDLGLFLDRIREQRRSEVFETGLPFERFKRRLRRGGLAFITYHFLVDGVTFEVKKYAEAARGIFKNIPIHYIAAEILPEAQLSKQDKVAVIPEINGFDDWKLYRDFFFTKLKRGNKTYNRLIGDFWRETLVIAEKLASYIEDNNIRVLYLINTHSNPGNVSLTLALVLISEYLYIPVLNNSHDFYWEGGHDRLEMKKKNLKPGPRDFFFKNFDVGEFFSIIQMLFPWESRYWLSININKTQTDTLIEKRGHNPANVTEIGTAVDTENMFFNDERRKIRTLLQISRIFSDDGQKMKATAVGDYLRTLNGSKNPDPVLIGLTDIPSVEFVHNIIFIQPTRIIERKRIEFNFELVKKLLSHGDFSDYFRRNEQLTLTILVTGPIAGGHFQCFKKILLAFQKLKSEIDPYFYDKVFIGFLFSEFDKPRFKKRFKNPITIADLYNVSSLVLLPSETEGRGLPIIEAAAAGIPIFTRRYYPHEAYAQVIGEHLSEEYRLRTLSFQSDYLSAYTLNKIVDRLIYPARFIHELEHNRRVVEKRFSRETLRNNLNDIIHKLYKQLNPEFASRALTEPLLQRYVNRLKNFTPPFKELVNTEHRQYLAGYHQLAFMTQLKSLIDPSYFRVEEQLLRGLIMGYARGIVHRCQEIQPISHPKLHKFYNAVDQLFRFHHGSINLRIDHSFAYRYRNKFYYPFRDLTFQQLAGAVNILFAKIIKPRLHRIETEKRLPHIPNLYQSLLQQTNAHSLAIDQTDELRRQLKSRVPYIFFPSVNVVEELDVFITRAVRSRLGLKPEQELPRKRVTAAKKIAPVYIFAPRRQAWQSYTARAIREYIVKSQHKDLRCMLELGLVKIVATKQSGLGIQFQQLGREALAIVNDVKNKGGFVISTGEDAAMTTDIVDIDVFHVGSARRIMTAKIMGIPENSGFVEWVPAGLRPTINYPLPIQTSKTLSDILKGGLWAKLEKKLGSRRKLLAAVRHDANLTGSTLEMSLQSLLMKTKRKSDGISYSSLSGVYHDGLPYSGIVAHMACSASSRRWRFEVIQAQDRPKTAQQFFQDFDRSLTAGQTRVVWNGGYLLNPELIGKLDLPQTYIGSPLGLVMVRGEISCPPLFNKPALLFLKDGGIKIKRVNCKKGLTIINPQDAKQNLVFRRDGYNRRSPNGPFCYYDLMYEHGYISGDGRILVRLSGNVVKEIIYTRRGEPIKQLPIGLTLSFAKEMFPDWIKKNRPVRIEIKEFQNVDHAIEAGPQLVRSGKVDIQMEKEGWKTANSIATQAARTDYEDMRGPKIAVGLHKNNDLVVVVVNGRLRESVGARHSDMARILRAQGVQNAIGFDPGGSSSLVVDGRMLNTSPFNHDYENDPYSLPSEPRPISNAVVGWQEE